jgi:hypothetical protein
VCQEIFFRSIETVPCKKAICFVREFPMIIKKDLWEGRAINGFIFPLGWSRPINKSTVYRYQQICKKLHFVSKYVSAAEQIRQFFLPVTL